MPGPESTPLLPAGANDSAATLLAVVDAYLEDLRRGQAPDRAAVLTAHPELAARLESCLAALDFIHRAERPDAALPPLLGDFRVLRESMAAEPARDWPRCPDSLRMREHSKVVSVR